MKKECKCLFLVAATLILFNNRCSAQSVSVSPVQNQAVANIVIAPNQNLSIDFVATLTPPPNPYAQWEFIPQYQWSTTATNTSDNPPSTHNIGTFTPNNGGNQNVNQDTETLKVSFSKPGNYTVEVKVKVTFKAQALANTPNPARPEIPGPVLGSTTFTAKVLQIKFLPGLNSPDELVQDLSQYKKTLTVTCTPAAALTWSVTGQFASVVSAQFQQTAAAAQFGNEFSLNNVGASWNQWKDDSVVVVTATSQDNPNISATINLSLKKFRRDGLTAPGSGVVKTPISVIPTGENPPNAVYAKYALGNAALSGNTSSNATAKIKKMNNAYVTVITHQTPSNGVRARTAIVALRSERVSGDVTFSYAYDPTIAPAKKDRGKGTMDYNSFAQFSGGGDVSIKDDSYVWNWAGVRCAFAVLGAVDGTAVTMTATNPCGLNYTRGAVTPWSCSFNVSGNGPSVGVSVPAVLPTTVSITDVLNGSGKGKLIDTKPSPQNGQLSFTHTMFLGAEAIVEQTGYNDNILNAYGSICFTMADPQQLVFTPEL
jgi:hypothetical protein